MYEIIVETVDHARDSESANLTVGDRYFDDTDYRTQT